MKLWALSDLHLGHAANRDALAAVRERPRDWLILGGDVGESPLHLELALEVTTKRFAQVIWVPGNHELWTIEDDGQRGQARYHQLVDLCRLYGVLTPEDPFPIWPGDGRTVIAPLFLLYDYSFRPDEIEATRAVAWAAEHGIVCADERFLHPDPFPSRQAWCAQRCREAEARLAEIGGAEVVIVNHFPLRRDLVRIAIPRFAIWCGTRKTEDWHLRFRARVVVSGHLHVRSTRWRDGVRFEEVSLGYPRHWRQELGMDAYLREILPGPI